MTTVDLDTLRQMHPKLPEATAAEHVHRAALALQRRHAPGASLAIAFHDDDPSDVELRWTTCSNDDAKQLDRIRVTEDGAEAVALAVVHHKQGWTVRRRLQRGDYADWLLHDPTTKRLVALELSGTDDGDDHVRMREKLAQVMQCRVAGQRAACVVRFVEPRVSLRFLPEVL